MNHAGILGWVFGLSDNARVNIAGLIALVAIIGEIGLFVSQNPFAKEFATSATPVITLALGYIFGKRSRPTTP